MGTWGSGVFENDTACDFAGNVAKDDDFTALEQTLDRVLATKGRYLEAPDAEEGLAAADIVARLNGSPGAQTPYTASIDAWVGRAQLVPSIELVEKARSAIIRILSEPSELSQAWQESEEFETWKRAVDELSQSF